MMIGNKRSRANAKWNNLTRTGFGFFQSQPNREERRHSGWLVHSKLHRSADPGRITGLRSASIDRPSMRYGESPARR
jgi:hypothetical protein